MTTAANTEKNTRIGKELYDWDVSNNVTLKKVSTPAEA